MNSLWIYHLVSEITMNSPSILRIHFSFIFGFANLLSISWKYTECTQCATLKLPKKLLHIGDIVAHWGHCPGNWDFLKNILVLDFLIFGLFFPLRKNPITKMYHKCTFCLTNPLWINYRFLLFTKNSLSISLCIRSLILWIHCLFCLNTMNSLSIAWIYYELALYIAIILWIHC